MLESVTSDLRKRQASTLVGTLTIQVVASANTLAFPVLVPVIPGAGIGQVGVFMMVVYVGAMLGAVFAGSVIARFGPVRASQFSLLVQALGLSCIAWAGSASLGNVPSTMVHILGALLCGAGYGPITPASSQMLMRTTPPERTGFVFSIKQTGVPLGGLVAGIALLPIAGLSNWVIGLMALVACSALVAVAVNPLQRVHDLAQHRAGPAAGSGAWRTVGLIMGDPKLRSAAGVSLVFSVCQLCVGAFLVVYLYEEVGFTPIEAGRIYALAQFSGIVGRLAWGRIADATGAPNAVLRVLAMILLCCTVATGLFTPHWPVLFICLIVAALGGTAIGWNGVFLGQVARLAPQGAVAAVTGGVLFFTYVGVVIGPLLFGYAGEAMGGLNRAFLVLTLAPLIALVLLPRR